MQDPIAQFQSWYFRLLPLHKIFVTLSFLIACLCTYEYLRPEDLAYTWQQTVFGLELWRPFTSLFFLGRLSPIFFYSLYIAYSCLKVLRQRMFVKEPYIQFIWFCLIMLTWSFVGASLIRLHFVGDVFLFSLVCVWAFKIPYGRCKLFLGLQTDCLYAPWLLAVFFLIMGFSLKIYLLGYGLARLYVFIDQKISVRFRIDFLGAPAFLKSLGSHENPPRNQEMPQQQ